MRKARDDAEQCVEFLVEFVEEHSIIQGRDRHYRRGRRRCREISFVNRQNHIEIGDLREIVVELVHGRLWESI